MTMMMFSSLRTAILVASATLLSAGAQAGPMPTNVAAMESMVNQNTTEVRWGRALLRLVKRAQGCLRLARVKFRTLPVGLVHVK